MSEKRDREIAANKSLPGYEQVAEAARSFTDPVRLEIIEALAQSARTVDSLARVCGLPLKNISHHLQRLRVAGLVDRVKLGRRAVYSLKDDGVASFWVALRQFAEDHPTGLMDSGGGPAEEGVTAESLAQLLDQQRVVVIDVRPPEEYAHGHLTGAISIPLAELEKRLGELPRGRPVVAFCRGPYCRLADRAIDLLRRSGFEALRCADGVVEWRVAGLPIEDEEEKV